MDRNGNEIEVNGAHLKRVLHSQVIGTTHTSRLLRGASRLAADLDVPADVAGMVLGYCVEDMLREGRY